MLALYACRLPLAASGAGAFDKAVEVVSREFSRTEKLDEPVVGDRGSLKPASGESVTWRLLTAPGVGDRVSTLCHHRPDEEDVELLWTLTVRGRTRVAMGALHRPRTRRHRALNRPAVRVVIQLQEGSGAQDETAQS